MKVKIEGMMCLHCAGKVKEGLESLDGVKNVEINLKKKTAEIESELPISEAVIKEKVESLGYKYIKLVKWENN